MKFQFANRQPVVINEGQANLIRSVINVTGIQGLITDVNISIDVDHSYTSDLTISLIAPDGSRVVLVENEGGKQDNFVLTKFDDSAFQSVAGSIAPFTGNFKPEESLDVFNQLDPNGSWTLEINDRVFKDGGMLKSWMLEIEAPETNVNTVVFENSNPQSINPGQSNTVISVINVTGYTDKILEEINVTIDIDHSYDKDLTITLISPNNERVELVNSRGGSSNNFKSTTFTDHAENSISTGRAPFNNSFQPEESLSVLKDKKITGAWILEVVDNAWDDGGTLNFWSISIDTKTVPELPAEHPESEFQLVVEFLGGLTTTQQAIFEDAASRWREIIIGDLPPENINGMIVEGIHIGAKGESIDEAGGVLGQAGPIHLRQNSFLPATGIMSFDTADLDAMENNGSLLDVIIHEMGHVIGIGTIWRLLGLLEGAGSEGPLFTGEKAQQEYAELLGNNTDEDIPVEGNRAGPGTADAHWQDSTFGSELMTGYINNGVKNAISRLTVAALSDMGYQVNMSAADEYALPDSSLLAELSAAPQRRQCCLQHQQSEFIIDGKLLNIMEREVRFMEQALWKMSVTASSGISIGDNGSTEVGATTSIPVSLDAETSVNLDLQLADTDKLEVFTVVSSLYDGSIEISSNGNTFKLTGPLLLFGEFIKHFSSDLSTLSIENKSTTETVDLKVVIGRDLV